MLIYLFYDLIIIMQSTKCREVLKNVSPSWSEPQYKKKNLLDVQFIIQIQDKQHLFGIFASQMT